MKHDFLIVGQGLAGSLLGYELIQKGYSIQIIDPNSQNTSSKKAAGLYNPVTGRNMVVTWMADELFAELPEYYEKLETVLSASFHKRIPIYRPFYSIEELNDWMGKVDDPRFRPFVDKLHTKSLRIDGLQDTYGGIELKRCGFVDLPKMLDAFQTYFNEKGVLRQGTFDHDRLQTSDGIQYDDLEAKQIIFCDGPFVSTNPWWKHLPFKPVRGEIIDIKCALPAERIYNRGVFMLPKEGYFRVGSTYDHINLSFEPQEKGVKELQNRMTKLFDGDYELVAKDAGVRPATADRRPYIGWHPENKAVGIFNGFGTKGVSLVPYFSKLFADTIEGKTKIHSEADVRRVF
jgi:glycine oxidase